MGWRITCNFPSIEINDLRSALAHTLAMNWRIWCFFLELPLAEEVTETTNIQ